MAGMESAMDMNATPHLDMSVNTTGCCPKFDPEGWDGQELHFDNKPFLRATTRSVLHVPVNMGKVFARVQDHIEASDAMIPEGYLVLSSDLTPWTGEHLFAVSGEVEGEEMTTLSGDFITKVFEGPYREARHWHDEMAELVRARGKEPRRIFFFYTTCPKCAKTYGKNYVTGIAEI